LGCVGGGGGAPLEGVIPTDPQAPDL